MSNDDYREAVEEKIEEMRRGPITDLVVTSALMSMMEQ